MFDTFKTNIKGHLDCKRKNRMGLNLPRMMGTAIPSAFQVASSGFSSITVSTVNRPWGSSAPALGTWIDIY